MEAPTMVYLPGGTFLMGDARGYDNEKPVHPVRLDAFAMGQTPVMVGEYLRFCEATQSHWPIWVELHSRLHLATGEFDYFGLAGIIHENVNGSFNFDGIRPLSAVSPELLALPVVGVSWDDALAYCQWLSDQTGEVYQLTTEAQWEYVCRAGSDGRWCFDDDEKQLAEYAWFGGNAEGRLHPVAQKRANAFGLYDMHGNVREWCHDWYGANYYARFASGGENAASDARSNASNNPAGPESGSLRLARGGSWSDGADYCRSAIRSGYGPSHKSNSFGFRLARKVGLGAFTLVPMLLRGNAVVVNRARSRGPRWVIFE